MAKILVIDDDDQVRLLIRQMLERESHVVVEANDGLKGIALHSSEKPDLVISDLIMPGKDGLMAIQEMISHRPSLPIIAMSGGAHGNAAWLPIAKKCGAFRVLKKPFAQQQLLESVHDALRFAM